MARTRSASADVIMTAHSPPGLSTSTKLTPRKPFLDGHCCICLISSSCLLLSLALSTSGTLQSQDHSSSFQGTLNTRHCSSCGLEELVLWNLEAQHLHLMPNGIRVSEFYHPGPPLLQRFFEAACPLNMASLSPWNINEFNKQYEFLVSVHVDVEFHWMKPCQAIYCTEDSCPRAHLLFCALDKRVVFLVSYGQPKLSQLQKSLKGRQVWEGRLILFHFQAF